MPTFTAEIHRFPGPGGWHYVPVPPETADHFAPGMTRVAARIGATHWATSLLPKGDGTRFLALKAAVRKSEGLHEGDVVTVELEPGHRGG
ncbi:MULTISPECIES: DUF1905 domain-containing protein [Actinokineospora]|uniref:DUF1905 domain-containing protein n=1 Tax=Actinokineospora fastidiosa TaxID=1816 RepID=A0A918GI12_9PSEU|nr:MULTISPECIES: DUF1905 domain-containing protein [Actinokineospora]UVS81000.1 hypothetical protein Actkin_04752 [Actinokineospora sp. UTMC 2448]GGS38841.1 hypothetical protein GCM10010171_37230 [Actinokineospora fastidiosa]